MRSSRLKIRPGRLAVLTALILCCLLAAGCSSDARQTVELDMTDSQAVARAREQAARLPMPQDDGEPILVSGEIAIRAAHADQGYITLRCGGLGETRHKLQVVKDEKSCYYDLPQDGGTLVCPLQMGSGSYRIALYRQAEGDKYAQIGSAELEAQIASEFSPYLIPNLYVDYDRDSQSVLAGLMLAEGAQSDVEVADRLYRYVVGAISYDKQKAGRVEAGEITRYLPDPDQTLEAGTGICLDYAALFGSMLRANGIPAKLVTGYAEPGHIYHAWNLVYLEGIGWVGMDVESPGRSWVLADTTFAVSGSAGDATYFTVNEY